jgi:hypothetical protein
MSIYVKESKINFKNKNKIIKKQGLQEKYRLNITTATEPGGLETGPAHTSNGPSLSVRDG